MVSISSNAGKFVQPGGIIDVDVRVCKPPGHATPFLVLTVSNSRDDLNKVEDGEVLFVPFKAKRDKLRNNNSSASFGSEWAFAEL